MLRTTRFILLTLCVALSASAASALTITSASLGGDKACTTLVCTTQTSTFTSSSGSGGGTLTLSGTSLTYNVTIASALFTGQGGNPNVTFDNVNYNGSATVFTTGPLHTVTFGSASISGDLNGGGFATSAITVGGSCTDSGSALNCGLIFSLEAPDANFYFHTVNLSVPEPALSGLLGLALVGGAAIFRRR